MKKDYTKNLYKDLQGTSGKMVEINNQQIKLLVEKINDTINSDLSVFRLTLKKAAKPSERPQISTLTIGFVNKNYSSCQDIMASAKKSVALNVSAEPPKAFNINRCLNEFVKNRESTRNITSEMKIFFNEILIGCPMVLAICNASKFPKDLKQELNSLFQFAKKTTKEETLDGKAIREVVDGLENIKSENTLLNYTCINQQERINCLKEDLESKTQIYEKNNSEVEGMLKSMESKGQDLLKFENDMLKLKYNNKKLNTDKDFFDKKIEEKSKNIDQMEKNLEEEKNHLSDQLHSLTTKYHKHNEEYKFLSKKASESESLLNEKCVIHETLQNTNELFQKSSHAIQNYVNFCESNTKTPTKICNDFSDPYENNLESSIKNNFNERKNRKNFHRYVTRSSYEYHDSSPNRSDVDLQEIENNFKMLEKEKLVSD